MKCSSIHPHWLHNQVKPTTALYYKHKSQPSSHASKATEFRHDPKGMGNILLWSKGFGSAAVRSTVTVHSHSPIATATHSCQPHLTVLLFSLFWRASARLRAISSGSGNISNTNWNLWNLAASFSGLSHIEVVLLCVTPPPPKFSGINHSCLFS